MIYLLICRFSCACYMSSPFKFVSTDGKQTCWIRTAQQATCVPLEDDDYVHPRCSP